MPSLESKYRVLGLLDYFEVFIISAVVGFAEPDERIFRTAVAGMGMDPEVLLFVDDWWEYVGVAHSLGINGVTLARSGIPPEGGQGSVRSLTEVAKYAEEK